MGTSFLDRLPKQGSGITLVSKRGILREWSAEASWHQHRQTAYSPQTLSQDNCRAPLPKHLNALFEEGEEELSCPLCSVSERNLAPCFCPSTGMGQRHSSWSSLSALPVQPLCQCSRLFTRNALGMMHFSMHSELMPKSKPPHVMNTPISGFPFCICYLSTHLFWREVLS